MHLDNAACCFQLSNLMNTKVPSSSAVVRLKALGPKIFSLRLRVVCHCMAGAVDSTKPKTSPVLYPLYMDLFFSVARSGTNCRPEYVTRVVWHEYPPDVRTRFFLFLTESSLNTMVQIFSTGSTPSALDFSSRKHLRSSMREFRAPCHTNNSAAAGTVASC